MQANIMELYLQQISDIARGLPEEKLRKVLAFTQRVKDEAQRPDPPLSSQELLALAKVRAANLRRQSRPAVEAQYQALLQAIQADIETKGIVVEDIPGGD